MRKLSILLVQAFVAVGVFSVDDVWAQEDPAAEVVQEEERKKSKRGDNYDRIIKLRGPVKYVPPEKATGRQTLEIAFDVAKEIPDGTKINIELEYAASPVESTDYVFKGGQRKGLSLRWAPKAKLAVSVPGPLQYILRVRMYPDKQTAAVKKQLLGGLKKFPARYAPWGWYYADKPIKVGTPEEIRAAGEEICGEYEAFVDKLGASYKEIGDLLKSVEDGEQLVDEEGTLDVDGYTDLILEWRGKHAEIQKELNELFQTKSDLIAISGEAYASVIDLGRMVARFSEDRQRAVAKAYKVEKFRIKKSDEDDEESSSRSFNSFYRGLVSAEALNDKVDEIYDKACPEIEEEEPEPEPEAKPTKKAKSSKKAKSKKKTKKKKKKRKKSKIKVKAKKKKPKKDAEAE